jgi:hypothetical protein
LVSAIVLVMVGITARVAETSDTARLQAEGPVLKAGKPSVVTTRDDTTIR